MKMGAELLHYQYHHTISTTIQYMTHYNYDYKHEWYKRYQQNYSVYIAPDFSHCVCGLDCGYMTRFYQDWDEKQVLEFFSQANTYIMHVLIFFFYFSVNFYSVYARALVLNFNFRYVIYGPIVLLVLLRSLSNPNQIFFSIFLQFFHVTDVIYDTTHNLFLFSSIKPFEPGIICKFQQYLIFLKNQITIISLLTISVKNSEIYLCQTMIWSRSA